MLPDGSIPHYPGYGYSGVWIAGDSTFHLTLELLGHNRGRSAAYFSFRQIGGKQATFSVFMVDLLDMVVDRRWAQGLITGLFTPAKRGANYGIKLAHKEK